MAWIRFRIWFLNRNQNFSEVGTGTRKAIISQNSYEGAGIWKDCIIKVCTWRNWVPVCTVPIARLPVFKKTITGMFLPGAMDATIHHCLN
jgi:hypothetical protein